MENLDNIPVDAYLADALIFRRKEIELQTELMDWLPGQIIDCHAHCNLPQHVLSIDQKLRHHMMTTFPSFSLEQSYRVQEIFYPNKTVLTLRFPNAFRGIDHKSANQYLLEDSKPGDRVALYGIPTDIDYTVTMLKSERVAALKMYYMFFDPPAEKIYQFFPPEILEEAQTMSIPIILHLPKMITLCGDDLKRLIKDFPRLTIVLAHLGLPHLPVPGLAAAYREFAKADNVLMDTAMIPATEVVSLAISAFGSGRIMFGSDQPLNLIRSIVYIHPKLGQRLMTESLYHWSEPSEHERYGYLAKGVTHTQWQALSALREAIELLPPSNREAAKQLIFYDTAKAVYKF